MKERLENIAENASADSAAKKEDGIIEAQKTQEQETGEHRVRKIHGVPKGLLNSKKSLDEGTNRVFAILIWELLSSFRMPLTVREICQKVNERYSRVWELEPDQSLLLKNTARRYLEDMTHSRFRHFDIRKAKSSYGRIGYYCVRKQDTREIPYFAADRLLPLGILDVLLDTDENFSAREIGELLGWPCHRSTLFRILGQMEDYTSEYFLEHQLLSDEFFENGRFVSKYFLKKYND